MMIFDLDLNYALGRIINQLHELETRVRQLEESTVTLQQGRNELNEFLRAQK